MSPSVPISPSSRLLHCYSPSFCVCSARSCFWLITCYLTGCMCALVMLLHVAHLQSQSTLCTLDNWQIDSSIIYVHGDSVALKVPFNACLLWSLHWRQVTWILNRSLNIIQIKACRERWPVAPLIWILLTTQTMQKQWLSREILNFTQK